ncbi:unnamed protein product [Lupinus luteus]|uniref:Uncharacterized protein n=1 Tax=Lupinus luteus TaxID=3873 RepID=A0AAV1XJS5_LUPLU
MRQVNQMMLQVLVVMHQHAPRVSADMPRSGIVSPMLMSTFLAKTLIVPSLTYFGQQAGLMPR